MYRLSWFILLTLFSSLGLAREIEVPYYENKPAVFDLTHDGEEASLNPALYVAYDVDENIKLSEILNNPGILNFQRLDTKKRTLALVILLPGFVPDLQ